MIDLETLQKMWKNDTKIDRDNLYEESLNTPTLHAKYFEVYNNVFLLRALKAEKRRSAIYHKQIGEYYTGKADPEVYIENPFPKKIRDKETLAKYLEADEELSTAKLKVTYYDTMLNFLEDIIKQLHQRNYQIKNAIDYMKFQSGLG